MLESELFEEKNKNKMLKSELLEEKDRNKLYEKELKYEIEKYKIIIDNEEKKQKKIEESLRETILDKDKEIKELRNKLSRYPFELNEGKELYNKMNNIPIYEIKGKNQEINLDYTTESIVKQAIDYGAQTKNEIIFDKGKLINEKEVLESNYLYKNIGNLC